MRMGDRSCITAPGYYVAFETRDEISRLNLRQISTAGRGGPPAFETPMGFSAMVRHALRHDQRRITARRILGRI